MFAKIPQPGGKGTIQVAKLVPMQQTCFGGKAVIVITVDLPGVVGIRRLINSIRYIGIGDKLHAVPLADDAILKEPLQNIVIRKA